MQVPKCRRSNMTQSAKVATNANNSDTKIAVKAERSGFVRDGANCHREGRGDQGDGGEICVECGRERTEARDSARSDL